MPCVGDGGGAYLWRQLKRLDAQTGGDGSELPFVLRERAVPSLDGTAPRYASKPFGAPRKRLLEVNWTSPYSGYDLEISHAGGNNKFPGMLLKMRG